jgi:hypothetical protein
LIFGIAAIFETELSLVAPLHNERRMGFLSRSLREKFEEENSSSLKAVIRMFSGCEDHQTSADVSNVGSFQLPDPAGRAGGACTSALLGVLYKDHRRMEEDLSFTQVLSQMRENLQGQGYEQIPQVSFPFVSRDDCRCRFTHLNLFSVYFNLAAHVICRD